MAVPSSSDCARPALQRLPEELLQHVLKLLGSKDLMSLDLVSNWCYRLVVPILWREVNLKDRCRRVKAHRPTLDDDSRELRGYAEDAIDQHDDEPMIRKLALLISKPWLAAHVRTLSHSCHLPPPSIFDELPRTSLGAQTLSADPRTTKMIQLASRHMTNVVTLRIVFGHPNVTDALLRSLFDKGRRASSAAPIRRLWLEDVRIGAGCDLHLPHHPLGLPLELDFSGLESIRLRRLPLRPGREPDFDLPDSASVFAYARRVGSYLRYDGAGGQYCFAANSLLTEMLANEQRGDGESQSHLQSLGLSQQAGTLDALLEAPMRWDDDMYSRVAEDLALPSEVHAYGRLNETERYRLAWRGPWPDPEHLNVADNQRFNAEAQRERQPSAAVATSMLRSTSGTLTSLCFDWILANPYNTERMWAADLPTIRRGLFMQLAGLRFPNLRAFQLRNAMVIDTILPPGINLLDYSTTENHLASSGEIAIQEAHLGFLEFMEAHTRLQCLAWPMDAFFSSRPLSPAIADRVQAVISRLGRSLTDLRVDSLYRGQGERQSEERRCIDLSKRERRRRFVQDFASRMTKLEAIKIEGGMPRDERREAVRALQACPLNKIVMIGVQCPLGDTWATDDIGQGLAHSREEAEALEPEDEEAAPRLGLADPEPLPMRVDYDFRAEYGWNKGTPMLDTIASLHAATVTELKFCGFKGAPALFAPPRIKHPLLVGLGRFHILRHLVLGLCLDTTWEGARRDDDIIAYWLDARDPTRTAVMRVTDEPPEGWEKELRTKYAPDALAWHVSRLLGPFLSETAKSRPGGVHVRASVCIGTHTAIFDIDLRIGKGALKSDVCLGFEGPREELEPARRRAKMENRRWF